MAHLEKDSYYSVDIALRSRTPLDIVQFCMLRGLAVSKSVLIHFHQRTEPSPQTLDCQSQVSTPTSNPHVKLSALPSLIENSLRSALVRLSLRPAAYMSIPHSRLPECTLSHPHRLLRTPRHLSASNWHLKESDMARPAAYYYLPCASTTLIEMRTSRGNRRLLIFYGGTQRCRTR